MEHKPKVAVLGGGSWATAIVKMLLENVHQVNWYMRSKENIEFIKKGLLERGFSTPIIVDIHFNPAAAIEAAHHADKIRINPGNYVDKKKFRSDVI